MILQNNYLLILLSAIIVGISQHLPTFGFLSWFGLVPFLKVIHLEYNRNKLLKYSFLWGITYHLVVVFWLSTNIGTTSIIAFIIMVVTVLILSLNTVLISLLWHYSRDYSKKYNMIFFVIFWVVIEYIRSYGLLGFPWVSLANSQTNYLYLIQNVEYTGIYGITFWILCVNVFVFKTLKSKSKFEYLYYLILLILPWFIGYFLYHNDKVKDETQESLYVTVVQPNIGLTTKRDFQNKDDLLNTLIDSTRNNISANTDLIVWPESAMPFHSIQSHHVSYFLPRLFINDIHLLTGNIFHEGNNYYNSSILVNRDGLQGLYNKRQLVPLAEHFPFSENFDFLKNINIGQANFSKGKEDYVFKVGDYRFASLICIESTFPNINRRHANMGIDVMIYLVNDGWYLTPPEPEQHARQSIFRAIENRIPIIRCANTGISQIINSKGLIEQRIDLNKFGTMDVRINKNNYDKTFYTRFGDVFSLILLFVSMVILILSRFKNEKK
jgi:apolipoprotein N-acyltransferase